MYLVIVVAESERDFRARFVYVSDAKVQFHALPSEAVARVLRGIILSRKSSEHALITLRFSA